MFVEILIAVVVVVGVVVMLFLGAYASVGEDSEHESEQVEFYDRPELSDIDTIEALNQLNDARYVSSPLNQNNIEN